MSRRIEVELTSARDDGSWTWRAAGAREPRGVVASDLLPVGAKVGDVMRAEADFDLDGVTIISISQKQEKKRNEAQRIEIIGPPRRDDQLVTSTLTSRPSSDRGDRRERRDKSDRPGRTGGPGRPDRSERQERPDGRGRPDRAPREGQREGRGEGGQRERPRERAERPAPSADRRPPRPRPDEPQKPKPKRLRPARLHRAAVLEELPPEHRPIAEQVLAGDIPAVRQAIEKENATRTAAGQPTINGEELLALAEDMRPRLRTAEWRDRADSAMADIDELDLRDLRSVVVAADSAARDDETRALAAQLREALTKRVEAEQASWLADLTSALDAGRVVRALRLSSRPPKAGTILDPALVGRLSEGACASLTADAPADRWAAVLDASAYSPIRLTVKPQSIPEKPSDELLTIAKKLASRLPQIAAAFGIETTEKPARPRGPRRPLPPRPPVAPAEAVAPPAPVAPAEAVAPPEPVEPVAPEASVESVEQVEHVERPADDEVAHDT